MDINVTRAESAIEALSRYNAQNEQEASDAIFRRDFLYDHERRRREEDAAAVSALEISEAFFQEHNLRIQSQLTPKGS